MTLGAILAPHDAWLMIRGLRTLPLRMERIAATTQRVREFLERHARVRRVYSPHAAENPQLGLTTRQLRGASGLLTVQLQAADVAAVERFCDGLQRFLMTVSWGGYESLAFPVCAVHAAGAPMHPPAGASLDMVRLSIGLEDADLLIADLDAALARI